MNQTARKACKAASEQEKLDQLSVNIIRTLAMDAVQRANSGHPGTPMALAPVAYVLWDRYRRQHGARFQRRRCGAFHVLPLERSARRRRQRSRPPRSRHPDSAEGDHAPFPTFPPDEKGIASRDASGKALNAIASHVPWLVGGSADLAPSTKTRIADGGDFEAGSYYMRAAIRLLALMDLPVLHLFTHDSIGVGEDGPTHQPVEHLMSLRAIPQLFVIRPADANEVAESWRLIMRCLDHPAALVLSRQPLPTFDRTKYAPAEGLRRGAYVMADSDGLPEVILIGSGSEVQLCVAAYEQLKAEGVRPRVVSMPSWELFERQPKEYRDAVLPPQVRARVAVEAGTSLGWREFVGLDGRVVARRDFGASAPIKDLLKQFGFTPERVVAEARSVLGRT